MKQLQKNKASEFNLRLENKTVKAGRDYSVLRIPAQKE
jgi:hypothetical protein